MKILTIEDCKRLGVYCYSYNNGDYTYRVDGIWHLIREGKDLLKGIKATSCYSYDNGDYEYKVDDQFVRLNKNGDKL